MANLRVDKITSTETFETTGSVQFVNEDHLQIAANSDFDFGTEDFTVEWWQYLNGKQDEYQTVLSINYGTNPNLAIQSVTTTKTAQKVYVNGTTVTFTEESDGPISTWVHYALVRNGSGSSNLKIYRDGVQTGQGTYSGDIGSSSSTNYIGGYPSYSTVDLKGFISNFRIVKGTALYTANFKPPMRELENIPGTVLLACQSKTDASLEKTGKTITINGNAVASELTPGILTPVPRAGGSSAIKGSVEFDGTGDYMTVTETEDFDFGTGDFTIEYWYWESNNSKSERRTLDMRDSTRQWMIGNTNDNGGKIFFEAVTGGVTVQVFSENNANTTSDRENWRHLAVVRNGNTITIYLDGINRGSGSFTGTIRDDQNTLNIGRDSSATTRNYQGFLSNLRVVKGTALYVYFSYH